MSLLLQAIRRIEAERRARAKANSTSESQAVTTASTVATPTETPSLSDQLEQSLAAAEAMVQEAVTSVTPSAVAQVATAHYAARVAEALPPASVDSAAVEQADSLAQLIATRHGAQQTALVGICDAGGSAALHICSRVAEQLPRLIGGNVLFVDAAEKPKHAPHTECGAWAPTLSNVWRGSISLAEAVLPTAMPGVHRLVVGSLGTKGPEAHERAISSGVEYRRDPAHGSQPAETNLADRVRECLAAWAADYRLILLSCNHQLRAAQQALLQHAEAVYLIVSLGTTERRAALTALDQVRRLGVREVNVLAERRR